MLTSTRGVEEREKFTHDSRRKKSMKLPGRPKKNSPSRVKTVIYNDNRDLDNDTWARPMATRRSRHLQWFTSKMIYFFSISQDGLQSWLRAAESCPNLHRLRGKMERQDYCAPTHPLLFRLVPTSTRSSITDVVDEAKFHRHR